MKNNNTLSGSIWGILSFLFTLIGALYTLLRQEHQKHKQLKRKYKRERKLLRENCEQELEETRRKLDQALTGSGLYGPVHKTLLLRLAGYQVREIAQIVDKDHKTVEGYITDLKKLGYPI